MRELINLRYFHPPYNNPTEDVVADYKLRFTDHTNWQLALCVRFLVFRHFLDASRFQAFSNLSC